MPTILDIHQVFGGIYRLYSFYCYWWYLKVFMELAMKSKAFSKSRVETWINPIKSLMWVGVVKLLQIHFSFWNQLHKFTQPWHLKLSLEKLKLHLYEKLYPHILSIYIKANRKLRHKEISKSNIESLVSTEVFKYPQAWLIDLFTLEKVFLFSRS